MVLMVACQGGAVNPVLGVQFVKRLANNKQRDWGQVRVAKISLRNWTQNLPRFFHSSSTVAVFITAPRFHN